MELTGIISTTISTLGAIGIALVGVHQVKNQKRNDKCEELRAEASLLQMELSHANLQLSKVTAKAVRNQKLNGDVEDAEKKVRDAEEKYVKHMQRLGISI